MANRSARRSERGQGHLEIAAALGSEILSGARKPGSRLPAVNEMFERFGVSRVVMREVVRTLAAKGMVTSKPRVGTRVSEPSNWSWLDPQVLEWRGKVGLDQVFLNHLTEVRLALEPAAAGLAAENRTEQDLAAMRAGLKGMYEAEGSRQKFSKADRDFHHAIIAATHNPFFYSSTSATGVALFSFLNMIVVGVVAGKETHMHSAAQHEKILDAIEARDKSAAAKAMIRVINEGLKHASSQLQTKEA